MIAMSIISISLTAFATGVLNPVGNLRFEKRDYDFGTVPQHKTVTYRFRAENIGNEDIKIGKVSTNCGCTAAVPSVRLVKPHGKFVLIVKFNSGVFEGSQEKFIGIETSEGVRYLLSLHANVVKPYSFLPESLHFTSSEASNAGHTVKLKVNAGGDSDIYLKKIKDCPKELKVTILDKVTMSISVVGEVPAFEHEYHVLVQVNGTKDPVLYRVFLDGQLSFRSKPRVLLFIDVPVGSRRQQEVKVDTKGLFEIKKIVVEADWLKIEKPVMDGTGFSFVASTVPKNMKTGYGKTNVKVLGMWFNGRTDPIIIPVVFKFK